jgi:hypothetical protein
MKNKIIGEVYNKYKWKSSTGGIAVTIARNMPITTWDNHHNKSLMNALKELKSKLKK